MIANRGQGVQNIVRGDGRSVSVRNPASGGCDAKAFSGFNRACPGSRLRSCAVAQTPAQPAAATPIEIDYLGLAVEHTLPLSYLDQPPADEGVQGARIALADNQTTGQFLGQSFKLNEDMAPDAAAVIDAFKKRVAAGGKLFVTDLPAPLLLQVADLPEAKGLTLIDAVTHDDALRGESCRRNVLHTLPSRAMLADALMQYMVIKKWGSIALVIGGDPGGQGSMPMRSAPRPTSSGSRSSRKSPGPSIPAPAAPIPAITRSRPRWRASPRM